MTSQENVTGGYLTYHFNNVGTTMAVTNDNGEVSYLDPFGLAIYILQQMVDLASAIVSGLGLLAMISPHVAFVAGIVLGVLTKKIQKLSLLQVQQ